MINWISDYIFTTQFANTYNIFQHSTVSLSGQVADYSADSNETNCSNWLPLPLFLQIANVIGSQFRAFIVNMHTLFLKR